jgi:hypothetical protein
MLRPQRPKAVDVQLPRRGAEQGAAFGTLLTTARKLGHNAYERLCSIAGSSPLQAAGLAGCNV